MRLAARIVLAVLPVLATISIPLGDPVHAAAPVPPRSEPCSCRAFNSGYLTLQGWQWLWDNHPDCTVDILSDQTGAACNPEPDCDGKGEECTFSGEAYLDCPGGSLYLGGWGPVTSECNESGTSPGWPEFTLDGTTILSWDAQCVLCKPLSWWPI